jgi:hypothetical protein
MFARYCETDFLNRSPGANPIALLTNLALILPTGSENGPKRLERKLDDETTPHPDGCSCLALVHNE